MPLGNPRSRGAGCNELTPLIESRQLVVDGDPVKDSLVASLNRPGGNATGITIFAGGAVTKQLQLLHEIVPKAGTTAYLMNPSNPNAEIEMRSAQSAAASLGRITHRAGLPPRTSTVERKATPSVF
jgi:hypothetical protein